VDVTWDQKEVFSEALQGGVFDVVGVEEGHEPV
jgi:hypothetical protein